MKILSKPRRSASFLTGREPGTTIAVNVGEICFPLTNLAANSRSLRRALVQEPMKT